MEIKVRKIFRSGNVIGIPVRTPDQKKIGEIEEVVIDIQSGQVAYVVLSFGGYFGFNDKFFAVPWQEFELKYDDDGSRYFVLDTNPESLKQQPGFDKTDWPDVANTDWDAEVEGHYSDLQSSASNEDAGSASS